MGMMFGDLRSGGVTSGCADLMSLIYCTWEGVGVGSLIYMFLKVPMLSSSVGVATLEYGYRVCL